MKKVLLVFSQVVIFSITLQAQKWVQLGTGNNALNVGCSYSSISSITIDDSDYVYAAVESCEYGSYVAKWNGTNWNKLGTAPDSIPSNGPINSVAIDKKGNVYAAGSFTNRNKYYYVAKWDGTTWSELASSTDSLKANNSINAIVVDTLGNVYAAGSFTNSSGIHYVAQWNGTSWNELGGSNVLNANGSIYRMVISDSGNVYVAGNFSDANKNGYVAKWDGVQWHRIIFDGFGGSCDVLGVDKWENVYVAGLEIISLNAESIPSQYIQYAQNLFGLKLWNGKTWEEIDARGSSPVGDGGVTTMNEYYHSVAIDHSGNIYLGLGEQAVMDPVPNSFYVAKLTSRYTENILGMFRIVSVNPSIGPWNVSYSLAFDSHGNLYASGGGSQSPSNSYVAEWIVDTTAASGNNSGSTAVNPAISLSTKPVQNSVSNLSVYPNPSAGIIHIPDLSENVQLSVYNVLGESVISQQISKGSSYTDLSNLSTGIYTLVFNGQQNSYVPVKWVKE